MDDSQIISHRGNRDDRASLGKGIDQVGDPSSSLRAVFDFKESATSLPFLFTHCLSGSESTTTEYAGIELLVLWQEHLYERRPGQSKQKVQKGSDWRP